MPLRVDEFIVTIGAFSRTTLVEWSPKVYYEDGVEDVD